MDPQAELDSFFDKYTPDVAVLGRALLARMRARLPGAQILVYDNYNALAIGFAASEKTGDALLSIALYPKWVNLFFLRGAGLPDPDGLLKGSGSRVRHIRMSTADDFYDPGVQALIDRALARAEPPFDPAAEQRVVIKSVAMNQRPRRPAEAAGSAARAKPL